jgi:hypothetical protein
MPLKKIEVLLAELRVELQGASIVGTTTTVRSLTAAQK